MRDKTIDLSEDLRDKPRMHGAGPRGLRGEEVHLSAAVQAAKRPSSASASASRRTDPRIHDYQAQPAAATAAPNRFDPRFRRSYGKRNTFFEQPDSRACSTK